MPGLPGGDDPRGAEQGMGGDDGLVRGAARIRTQMSAALSRADLDVAVGAFVAARAAVGG